MVSKFLGRVASVVTTIALAACTGADPQSPIDEAWTVAEDVLTSNHRPLDCEATGWGEVVVPGDLGDGPRCFTIASSRSAAAERDDFLQQITATLPDSQVLGVDCTGPHIERSDSGPYCDAMLLVDPDSGDALYFSYLPAIDDPAYELLVVAVDIKQTEYQSTPSPRG